MSGEPVERSGNLYVSFTATGAINRYDYGLKWNEVMETGGFRVSNYVKINIQGNFIKEK
jgi:polyisoprenoid-binding protein YceI